MPSSNESLETSNQTSTPQDSNSRTNIGKVDKPPRNHRKQESTNLQQNANGESQKHSAEEGSRGPLKLEDLFKPNNPDDQEDVSFSVEDEDDPSKPVTSLDGVAKRLKIKPEQVYDLLVPMPNGAEPIKLGDLKDRVGELVDLDGRELEFNERRVKGEGELLRAQQEINEILGMIPKEQIKPEVVEKMRKKHLATVQRERELTLDHIPQWQNEQTRLDDMKGIVDMFKDYGFAEGFISTLVDHRAIKFVRDMYLMRRRIQKALKEVKIPPRKGKAPSHKTEKGAKVPDSNSNSTRHQPSGGAARLMQLIKEAG